ncbi:hypothetical protein Droror1_Dr00023079 [Drosera rotundifolia]
MELERAYQFIEAMPIPADAVLWRTLLGACKLNGNLALAEIATNKLPESDPYNSVNYVLLSNTYAGAEKWDLILICSMSIHSRWPLYSDEHSHLLNLLNVAFVLQR